MAGWSHTIEPKVQNAAHSRLPTLWRQLDVVLRAIANWGVKVRLGDVDEENFADLLLPVIPLHGLHQ